MTRSVDVTEPSTQPLPATVEVAIVGAGFGGIGAAIQLARAGITDVAVLERADELGGTWRDNTYPGCRCDVPSVLYSFSFAPNPDWSSSFSPQAEIWSYLRRVAAQYGVTERLYTRAELLAADWDPASAQWLIQTPRGSLRARFLICAQGPLSDPLIPTLPGLERFTGPVFHSATWRHDVDLTGRRVGVVGTGASAIQFIPAIAPSVAQLSLFQRTAPWVLPRRDRTLTSAEHVLYRAVPAAQRLARAGVYWARELTAYGFTRNPKMLRVGEKQALQHLTSQVADPGLRAKLTPQFRLGCKRVLLSNDYYPSLTRSNVEVVTERILDVTPGGVVTASPDGTGRVEHEVDTLIFGTGFQVTDIPIADRVRGVGATSLRQAWAAGMSAYRGASVAGFPNLFLLVGPNTGLGHTSIIFMIESQLAYLVDFLRQLRSRGIPAVDVRPEVQADYHAWVQRRSAPTVWLTGGCASWYLDDRGHNTTLWPDYTVTFRRQNRRCDLADYIVVGPDKSGRTPASTATPEPVG